MIDFHLLAGNRKPDKPPMLESAMSDDAALPMSNPIVFVVYSAYETENNKKLKSQSGEAFCVPAGSTPDGLDVLEVQTYQAMLPGSLGDTTDNEGVCKGYLVGTEPTSEDYVAFFQRYVVCCHMYAYNIY